MYRFNKYILVHHNAHELRQISVPDFFEFPALAFPGSCRILGRTAVYRYQVIAQMYSKTTHCREIRQGEDNVRPAYLTAVGMYADLAFQGTKRWSLVKTYLGMMTVFF